MTAPGLLQKISIIKKTLQLEQKLALRDAVDEANLLVGLTSAENEPLLTQVDTLLATLGIDGNSLEEMAI